MARFCTSCGAGVEGLAFCTQCGAPQAAQPGPGPSAGATAGDEAGGGAPMAWSDATPFTAGADDPWSTSTTVMSATPPGSAPRRRRGALVALALALVLGGAGGGAFWLLREPDPVTVPAGAAATADAVPSTASSAPATSETTPSTSASASASEPGTSPTTSGSPSPVSTTAAPGLADDPLGLGVRQVDVGCTGEYVVVLASSGTPREYVSTLAPAVAVPGARYLATDGSCSSFVQDIAGRRIYAAYVGPFPDLLSACAALETSGVTGGYARLLDEGTVSRSVCACRTEVSRPRLSRIVDEEADGGPRSRAVSDAQVLLARAGYNQQNAFGGAFGELTDTWVRDFQRDVGLRRSGVITPATWDALLLWCEPQDF